MFELSYHHYYPSKSWGSINSTNWKDITTPKTYVKTGVIGTNTVVDLKYLLWGDVNRSQTADVELMEHLRLGAEEDRPVEIGAAKQPSPDEQSETERLRKIGEDIRITKELEVAQKPEKQRIPYELKAAKEPAEWLDREEQERLMEDSADERRLADSTILEREKRVKAAALEALKIAQERRLALEEQRHIDEVAQGTKEDQSAATKAQAKGKDDIGIDEEQSGGKQRSKDELVYE